MQEYSYLFAFCKIYQYGIIKNRFKILFEFFAHWVYVYRIALQLSNQILKFSLNWNTQKQLESWVILTYATGINQV